jgi:DDE domain
MAPLCYRRHRFPPEIIQHAIWLYLRFTLSYRDVEELLAQRGLDISYETVRRWVLKFGPAIARRLRQRRPRPSDRWHLDEMVVRIAGERMYLWRAVDDEGEVLDMLVQRRRDGRRPHPASRCHSFIGDPVPRHPNQPAVVNGIEKSSDVEIEHPVHTLRHRRFFQGS